MIRNNDRAGQIDRLLSSMQPMGLGGFGFRSMLIDDRWDDDDFAPFEVPAAVRYNAWNSGHPDLVGRGPGIEAAVRDLLAQIEARTDAETAAAVLHEFHREVWGLLTDMANR
jgi:hypothetical protein